MLTEGVRTLLGDDLVQQVLSMLDQAQAQVRQSEDMQKVPATSLGGAPTAAELELHAGKAHSHVVQAMSQMAKGLQGYYDSVEHFRRDVHRTDEEIGSALTRRVAQVETVSVESLMDQAAACMQSQNFHGNASCEVPADGGDR